MHIKDDPTLKCSGKLKSERNIVVSIGITATIRKIVLS
jgi:hypothetical protein